MQTGKQQSGSRDGVSIIFGGMASTSLIYGPEKLKAALKMRNVIRRPAHEQDTGLPEQMM